MDKCTFVHFKFLEWKGGREPLQKNLELIGKAVEKHAVIKAKIISQDIFMEPRILLAFNNSNLLNCSF